MQALLKMLGTVNYVVGHCDSDGPETHPSVALCAMKHILLVLPLDGSPWRTVCSTSVRSYGASGSSCKAGTQRKVQAAAF